MNRQQRIYTKEILEPIVRDCFNYAQVCRALGVVPKGGSYQLIKSRIKDFEFDTSHFLGYRSYCGKDNSNYDKRTSKESILREGCIYRTSHNKLKRALLESGIIYECSECKLTIWNNIPIGLEIDHINGDWSNNLLSNLRFMCPNCHSQTSTHNGKNSIRGKKGKLKIHITKERKINIRPDQMSEMVFKKPITHIALALGVSDSAVLKYCKKNKIETPRRGYWTKVKYNNAS